MKRTLNKEMACRRKDFLRILPKALGSEAFEVSGETITFEDGPRRWVITHTPLSDRVLGGMSVPRADVCLELEGFSDEEADGALARFELHFHRGGG